MKQRFFNYLVFTDSDDNTLICKRTQKGIWHNLYEFPLLETLTVERDEKILELIQNQIWVSNQIKSIVLFNPEAIVHKLSHQQLNVKFWKIKVEGNISNGINWKSAQKMPFPIIIFNFILNNNV